MFPPRIYPMNCQVSPRRGRDELAEYSFRSGQSPAVNTSSFSATPDESDRPKLNYALSYTLIVFGLDICSCLFPTQTNLGKGGGNSPSPYWKAYVHPCLIKCEASSKPHYKGQVCQHHLWYTHSLALIITHQTGLVHCVKCVDCTYYCHVLLKQWPWNKNIERFTPVSHCLLVNIMVSCYHHELATNDRNYPSILWTDISVGYFQVCK